MKIYITLVGLEGHLLQYWPRYDVYNIVKIKEEEEKISMVKKHYIAMAGLHGYLPQYCASHDTYEGAMEDLISLYEIEDRELKEELKEEGFV